jgi:hypothetical protein
MDSVSLEVLNISNLWGNISKILFFYENNPMSLAYESQFLILNNLCIITPLHMRAKFMEELSF